MVETVVKIDGMMCGMCESHICEHIRRNFKVRKVSASHRTGQLVDGEVPERKLMLGMA